MKIEPNEREERIRSCICMCRLQDGISLFIFIYHTICVYNNAFNNNNSSINNKNNNGKGDGDDVDGDNNNIAACKEFSFYTASEDKKWECKC